MTKTFTNRNDSSTIIVDLSEDHISMCVQFLNGGEFSGEETFEIRRDPMVAGEFVIRVDCESVASGTPEALESDLQDMLEDICLVDGDKCDIAMATEALTYAISLFK